MGSHYLSVTMPLLSGKKMEKLFSDLFKEPVSVNWFTAWTLTA